MLSVKHELSQVGLTNGFPNMKAHVLHTNWEFQVRHYSSLAQMPWYSTHGLSFTTHLRRNGAVCDRVCACLQVNADDVVHPYLDLYD